MGELTIVHQPEGTKLCGQCCVAALTGETLQVIKTRIGKSDRHGTTETDLRYALKFSGLDLQRPFQRGCNVPHHGQYLVRFKFPRDRKGYHWIVVTPTFVFDPCLNYLMQRIRFPMADITSFAEVRAL